MVLFLYIFPGVYETPAGTILHTAHTDLEVFILDKVRNVFDCQLQTKP